MVALIAAGLASSLAVGSASAQTGIEIDRGANLYAGEAEVPVNKSIVLRSDQIIRDILVGNPEIADVIPLTDRSVYVLGRQLGSTSLSIYGPNRQLVSVLDLNVTYDTEALKRRLFELVPGENIEVRTINDALVLSGEASSPARLQAALSVAEQIAPGRVTNLVQVAGSQQVMLEVRVAEVSRSVVKQIGLGLETTAVFGDSALAAVTGGLFAGGVADPTAYGALLGSLARGDFALDILLDALEQDGLLKTLAEPNLIALSGETATFLAGGEFPIPVAAATEDGELEITIEFKEFGVSLAFTPIVLGDGSIHLEVAPEVSAIDPTTSVTLENIVIPGLATRRASTTVDLRDGESFAIAGLISSDLTSTVRQLPGLGEIPVLGALFRSTAFQREETELVIIVTPHLVRAANPNELALPTDSFVPASDLRQFFLGKLQANRAAGSYPLVAQKGGIDGDVGHLVK